MALRREAIITRIRSMTGVRLIPANLSSFQREICGDNSEFGSDMASQAVQLRKSVLETRIELPPKELDQIHDRPLRAIMRRSQNPSGAVRDIYGYQRHEKLNAWYPR